MKRETPLYCCYSLEQRKFLTKRNIKYEVVGLNPNNQQMFWVYIRNKELNDALNLWTARKQQFFFMFNFEEEFCYEKE